MTAANAPFDLRCEYKTDPLGIDELSPRLSWKLSDERRGAHQTAYRILVAESPDALAEDRGDAWDSGRVSGDQSIHVPYAGTPLASGQRRHWKVRTWDADGQPSPWSEAAWWEMGLLEKGDWSAAWIGSPLAGGPHTSMPCPFLRREVSLDRTPASARLYVTALGVYEFRINGERVGDDVFTPGWTDYGKRIQYQTYDVTSLLTRGANALGAILGDGWYSGFIGFRPREFYGDRPRLLAQLVVRYEEGSTQTVTTDDAWRVSFGPILEADNLMGESYDARREMPGWDRPAYDAAAWQSVQVFDAPNAPLVAPAGPTVRRIEEIVPIAEPRELPHWPNPRWLFDLGQNMVGRVRLKVSGPAGATVTLKHAEILNPDGTPYYTNLRAAKATDHYTLRGGGEEIWEPRFTFHGFRYVELLDYPGKPTASTVTGIVLHSDTPPTGEFECSDPLVNQLQHNIQWGQKGNFLEVPTDCPQRDERLGWTGDAQVFIRTAAFNMDVASFFTKWVQDLVDSQSAEGAFPSVAPNIDLGPDGGPAWADAGVICPWTVYLCYGDTRLLERSYAAMQAFVGYLEANAIDLVRCHPDWKGHHGYGDWLSINAETPRELIGTAFFAYSAKLLSTMAGILGRTGDAERYAALSERVRGAFVDRYVTKAGLMVSQTQTACILALHFDLAPAQLRPAIADALVRDIRSRGMHLSAGFVGSPYINQVLTETGHLDVAYELLHQKSWPSWLYAVTQGATTIWERWDGWTHDKGFQDAGMNSFNHYAYGAIGAWLYATVAGLDVDPARPAFKHAVIAPRPGGGLTHARAELETPYGPAKSAWRIDGDRLTLDVAMPPNTTATVTVPTADPASVQEDGRPVAGAEGIRRTGDATYEIGAGRYTFTAKAPA